MDNYLCFPSLVKSTTQYQFCLIFIFSSDLLSNCFNITDDYLDAIESAIDQVKVILESIELLQSLFPTTKSMRREYDVCASQDFQVQSSYVN